MAKSVQRNFPLPVEQAEWLRAAAFEHRLKQAEIVRYALAAAQADFEGRPRPPLPTRDRHSAASSLGGSLADGPDLAARLLEERRREERR